SLFRRRLRLAGTSIPQNKNPPVLVSDINIAAGVHEHIFGLAHELVIGKRPIALCWRRWNEPTDFSWQSRILDVVNTQSGVKVSKINQIALLFDVRQMVFEIRVVRSEPSTLVAKIRIWSAFRRHRRGKGRGQIWLSGILDIDHGNGGDWSRARGEI